MTCFKSVEKCVTCVSDVVIENAVHEILQKHYGNMFVYISSKIERQLPVYKLSKLSLLKIVLFVFDASETTYKYFMELLKNTMTLLSERT